VASDAHAALVARVEELENSLAAVNKKLSAVADLLN